MLRPNRIGPWPFADIEVPPWAPSTTLLNAIDNVASPLIGGGVRSVTVPSVTNYEHWYLASRTQTTTQATSFALGCLINGTNRKDDINTIYTITGNCQIGLDASDVEGWLFPFIAKLDATPSDPDALITITDYAVLPIETFSNVSAQAFYASCNTQITVGNVRGSTSSQSDLPIFVGWGFQNGDTANYVIEAMRGCIGVYKYTEDINVEDHWR